MKRRCLFLAAVLSVFWGGRMVFAEMQVRLFSPPEAYVGVPCRYTVATVEAMKGATLLTVEDASGRVLHENLPLSVEGGIYAATRRPLFLPAEGGYRFRAALTDHSGATSFFSFPVRCRPAPKPLRDFRVSKAPYYVGQSFEVAALFASLPGSVDIGILKDGDYQGADVVLNSGDLEAIGYPTPRASGVHEVVLTFVDPSTRKVCRESIPVYVDTYDRGGGKAAVEKGGGGCRSFPFFISSFFLVLFFFGVKREVKRGRGRTVCLLLLAVPLALAAFPAGAATYRVTDPGDDMNDPPAGSLRSILWTIRLLGTEGDVIQFAPSVHEIDLCGVLDASSIRGLKIDASTGREGKRLVLGLRDGGYRHLHAAGDFLANGLVLKGFGRGDPRNTGECNGGLLCNCSGFVLEDCSFVDIAGGEAAVVVSFDVHYGRDSRMERCLFRGNKSRSGPGALLADGVNLTLLRTFVGWNRADRGGAAAVFGPSPWPSVHNTIVGNRLGNVVVSPDFTICRPAAGHAAVEEVPFAAHHAFSPSIRKWGPEVCLVLKDCLLVDNETESAGGAVEAQALTLCNSTLFGNVARRSDSAVSGVQPLFYASLLADGLEDGADGVALDENRNLVEAPSVDMSDGTVGEVFELWPPEAEDRGGYAPTIPIRYAGPAEGRVSADLPAILTDYPWNFRADARGVPRDYSKGASVGAWGFGQVSLLPGNIRNSTTIAFRPKDTGSIKVKLVEKIETGSDRVTNCLKDVKIRFELMQGNNLGRLPQVRATEDNGRAFVVVDTLEGGDGTVRASVANRPSQYLDLSIRLRRPGQGEPTPQDGEDDLYVVALSPNRTKNNVENTYVATYSRSCAYSTVSIRRKGRPEEVEKELPIAISDSVRGTISKRLTFAEKGSYIFGFRMTDPAGRSYEDSKEVRVSDASLKVFRLSDPPYYQDKTLSMIAVFTKVPRAVDMTLTDEDGREFKPDIRYSDDRLEWEGLAVLRKPGYYAARLDYTDGGEGTARSERYTIRVAEYYGDGSDTTAMEHGSGCNALYGAAVLFLLVCLLLFGRSGGAGGRFWWGRER